MPISREKSFAPVIEDTLGEYDLLRFNREDTATPLSFDEIKTQLAGKNTLLLVGDQFFYADIEEKTVRAIEIPDSKERTFNRMKDAFTAQCTPADLDQRISIQAVIRVGNYDLLPMDTDPTTLPFSEIQDKLGAKSAIILFDSQFFYANLANQTVQPITVSDEKEMAFNRLQQEFPTERTTATLDQRHLLHDVVTGGRGELRNVGDLKAVHSDMSRDAGDIFFNGKSLVDLALAKMGISTTEIDNHLDMSDEEKFQAKLTLFNDAKEDGFTIDHLREILREELLAGQEEHLQTEYLEKTLCRYLYQHGLIYAASQALKETIQKDGGMIGERSINKKANIYLMHGNVCIDEQTSLMNYRPDISGTTGGEVMQNKDDSPLVTIRNRYHLQLADGRVSVTHADIAIDYNNDTLQKTCDTRGMLTKFKDLVKDLCNRIFGKEVIQDFSFKDDFSLAAKSTTGQYKAAMEAQVDLSSETADENELDVRVILDSNDDQEETSTRRP